MIIFLNKKLEQLKQRIETASQGKARGIQHENQKYSRRKYNNI